MAVVGLIAFLAGYPALHIAMLIVPTPLAVGLVMLAIAAGVTQVGTFALVSEPSAIVMLCILGVVMGMLVRAFGPRGKRDRNYWIGAAIIAALFWPIGVMIAAG